MTFELPDRDPETLFALSYDIALLIGLRDSFSLFARFPQLTKLWSTAEEREYLVSIHALSPNVKRKNIAIVDVRQAVAVLPHDLLVESNKEAESPFPEEDEAVIRRSKRFPKSSPDLANATALTTEELLALLAQQLSQDQMQVLNSFSLQDKSVLSSIVQAFQFNSQMNQEIGGVEKVVENGKREEEFQREEKCKGTIYLKCLSSTERKRLEELLIESKSPLKELVKDPESEIVYNDSHPELYPIPVMKGQYYSQATKAENKGV